MTVDTVVGNGLVVAPGGIIRGGVAIEGERIVAVGPDAGLPPARRRIEAGEGYIIPGFIDAHVHLGPGGVDWPPTARDFYTESRAAAFGGVTSALVFLFSLDSYLPVFDDIVAWGQQNSVIDFAFHAGINSFDQIAEIPALAALGITSFKHFFTANRRSGHGIIEAMDQGSLYASFRAIAATGGLAQVHCEDIDLINFHEAAVRAGGRRDLEAWSLCRPPLSEALAIAQVGMIAREAGTRAYVVHLSSAAGLEAVERAKHSGADLTAETSRNTSLWIRAWRPRSAAGASSSRRCAPRRIRTISGGHFATARSARSAPTTFPSTFTTSSAAARNSATSGRRRSAFPTAWSICCR